MDRSRTHAPAACVRAALFIGILVLSQTTTSIAGQWPWTRWTVECLDPESCEPANELYAEQLEKASDWLDGLDFAAPKVPNACLRFEQGKCVVEDRAYLAEISDRKNCADDGTPNPECSGERPTSVGVYYPTTSRLYLRSDMYFTLGSPGELHESPSTGLERSFTFTPIHELFHAVQNNYHDILDSGGGWIWEGTANMVKRAYADQHEPEMRVAMSTRRFDEPLHKPSDKTGGYGTWYFWRYVGERIGSPSNIAYIAEILGEDLKDNHGLDGVDAALSKHGGLYDLVPEFFSTLDISEHEHFGPIDQIEAEMPNGETEHRWEFGSAVNEVAGTSLQLRVAAGSASTSKPLDVEIKLREDHENLHLIVDGTRYDKTSPALRNRFEDRLRDVDDTQYNIIVANVARKAPDTTPQNFFLEVALRQVSDSWVRINGEMFEMGGPVCSSAGVMTSNLREGERGLGFMIHTKDGAPDGTTRAAWGGASVGASIWTGACDWYDPRNCKPEGSWGAGGPRTPGPQRSDFNVEIHYDRERRIWSGGGTVTSERHGLASMEFSIQCRKG